MKTLDDYSHDDVIERVLERKRINLTTDYDLVAKPALIWQCMPAEPIVLDVSKNEFKNTLGEGVQGKSTDGWWEGFYSGRRVTLVFDGLASSTSLAQYDAGWVAQLHEDGHLLAGLWTFPQVEARDSGTPSLALADLHQSAFHDFMRLAEKIYQVADYRAANFVTCTMLQAHTLPMVTNHGRIQTPPVKRQTLRWPVLAVGDTLSFAKAGEMMAARLMRAYGLMPTNA